MTTHLIRGVVMVILAMIAIAVASALREYPDLGFPLFVVAAFAGFWHYLSFWYHEWLEGTEEEQWSEDDLP